MGKAPSNAAMVREQFTLQARDFVSAQHATDAALMAQYIDVIGPAAGESLLDVAAGPGLVAAALGAGAGEGPGGCRVTIMDLTPRMLMEAARVAPLARRVEGDALRLPWRSGTFDAVICRLALHHVPDPAIVVREMARVVRATPGAPRPGGGRVVINDIITGEDPAESAVTEEIERLRDPSHTRCLGARELVRLVLEAGMKVESITPWRMIVDHDEWMNRVYPPEENRRLVRERLEALAGRDLGGMSVERRDGALWISRRGIIVRAHV